jgi:hypothetical protein
MRRPRGRRGRGRGRRGRGHGRRSSDTYDPPAHRSCTAQDINCDTFPPFGTHGYPKPVPKSRCHCPVTPSYVFGISPCTDCGGHRSTYRLSNNHVATPTPHGSSSSTPSSPASVEFSDTLHGYCCRCATSSSYLYGADPCPECGGRRRSHHLNCNCLTSPTYLPL